MTRPKNFFWDSCCFIRFITRYPELLADMEQYIKEARDGSIAIHFCTVAFAEIRPRYFKESSYGSIEEFFDHWGSAFVPIDPGLFNALFFGLSAWGDFSLFRSGSV